MTVRLAVAQFHTYLNNLVNTEVQGFAAFILLVYISVLTVEAVEYNNVVSVT